MIEQTIRCDVCGIEKRRSNHWFRATVQNGVYRSGPYREGQKPWVDEKHVCGPGHADTLHNRFVTTGRLDMEMHPEPVKPQEDESIA